MAKIPVTISIDPEIYQAVERLSILQGSSKASIINSHLLPAVSVMNSLCDLIETLQNSSPDQRLQILSKMQDLESKTLTQIDDLNASTKGLTQ